MLDILEFNKAFVTVLSEEAKKDQKIAEGKFRIDAETIRQLAKMRNSFHLALSCSCIASSQITDIHLNKRALTPIDNAISTLNMSFLSVIWKLVQTSTRSAIGLTGINKVCCSTIKNLTIRELQEIANANGPLFAFSVKAAYLAKINAISEPSITSDFLLKNAAIICGLNY